MHDWRTARALAHLFAVALGLWLALALVVGHAILLDDRRAGEHLGRDEADHGQYDEPREVDHNPTCNYVLRREAVAGVKFHPTLWPGEDVEFDIRLQQVGHRILYAPDVVVWHHRRSRPLPFLRQMFNYGVTRAQVTRMHPGSFDPRHYAFIGAFVVLMSLYGLAWQQPTAVPWLLPAALNLVYFGVLGLAGLLVGTQTRSFKQALYAPLVLFIQHFGYSLGLLVGLLRRP